VAIWPQKNPTVPSGVLFGTVEVYHAPYLDRRGGVSFDGGRIGGVRQIVATIDGRPRQAGDRYTLSSQTPRPAAVASEMGHNRKNRSTFHKQAKKVKLPIGVAKTGRGEVLSR
jgi:hypothetical protein